MSMLERGFHRARQAVQMHDHERSRSAGGGESLGPPVPGAGAESALGGRHNGVRHRRQRETVLAAVLDLFSQFVVGWAVSGVTDRHLAIRALAMALKRRCPDADCCTTPITVVRTPPRTNQTILKARGITCSVSR
jgi:transposase InsO family protein